MDATRGDLPELVATPAPQGSIGSHGARVVVAGGDLLHTFEAADLHERRLDPAGRSIAELAEQIAADARRATPTITRP